MDNGGIFTVIIKCKKCGKEYELGTNEKVSNFLCECGGELSPLKKTVQSNLTSTDKDKSNIVDEFEKPNRNKRKWVFGVFCIGLIIVVVLGGMLFNKTIVSWNSNTTSLGNSTNHIQNSSYSKKWFDI